jgi:hypothetical protein
MARCVHNTTVDFAELKGLLVSEKDRKLTSIGLEIVTKIEDSLKAAA